MLPVAFDRLRAGRHGKVLLTGPSAVVHKLKAVSSNPTPAGQVSLDMRMTAGAVKVATPVTITVSDQDVSKSCVVTLQPPAKL